MNPMIQGAIISVGLGLLAWGAKMFIAWIQGMRARISLLEKAEEQRWERKVDNLEMKLSETTVATTGLKLEIDRFNKFTPKIERALRKIDEIDTWRRVKFGGSGGGGANGGGNGGPPSGSPGEGDEDEIHGQSVPPIT